MKDVKSTESVLDEMLEEFVSWNDNEYCIDGKYVLFSGEVQDYIRDKISELKSKDTNDTESAPTIERVWAMPNAKTFTIKPIKELLDKEVYGKVLDPFPFEYKEDATDYMNKQEDESFDVGLFDPPYSPRQLKEVYKGKGEYDTKNSTWSNWKDLFAKKIKKGGKVISFGWNSGGLGMNRGFTIKRILLVAHGGNHNDTICVVEEKDALQSRSVTEDKR